MSYLAGVIDKQDQERFGRLVYRVTKGCTWTQTAEMKYAQDDPLLDSHTVPFNHHPFSHTIGRSHVKSRVPDCLPRRHIRNREEEANEGVWVVQRSDILNSREVYSVLKEACQAVVAVDGVGWHT